NAAVRVKTNKCPDFFDAFSVGDVNLPAPARRAEADGSWCCHLNPSSGLLRRSSPRRSVPTPRHVETAAFAGHIPGDRGSAGEAPNRNNAAGIVTDRR